MSVKIRQARLLAWSGLLTGFLFLCYCRGLSRLIMPCMFLYLLFEFQHMDFFTVKGWNCLYSIYLVCLCISLLAAFVHKNPPGSSLRFLFILILIPASAVIRERGFEDEWKIFRFFMILKAVSVIGLWIYAFTKQDVSALRQWALHTGAGDIYNFYQIPLRGVLYAVPKIQLRGNTVFVMAFGISLLREKRVSFAAVCYLLAGLAAGNSAYLLGYALFTAYIAAKKLKKLLDKRSSIFILLIPAAAAGAVFFAAAARNIWVEKAGFSNVVRYQQAAALLDTNPLTGSGLGNDRTGVAGYEGSSYFELQTLYVYNQIGMTGLVLFYVLTFAPYIRKRDRDKAAAYFIYLAYTFWNPYCFDSTHILAVILIGNAIKNSEEKRYVR